MKKQFAALPTAVLILGIITGCNTAGSTEGLLINSTRLTQNIQIQII